MRPTLTFLITYITTDLYVKIIHEYTMKVMLCYSRVPCLSSALLQTKQCAKLANVSLEMESAPTTIIHQYRLHISTQKYIFL